MTSKWLFRLNSLLIVSLTLQGCSEYASEDGTAIDLEPSSLEEARLSIQRIDQLYESDPVGALDATRKLRLKLDELNHLVARVEVAPDHFVDFYNSKSSILVAEHGSAGDRHVLQDKDVIEHSPIELYRQLTGGAAPPAVLVSAESYHESPRTSYVPGQKGDAPNESSEKFAPDQDEQPGDGFSSVVQSLTGADWAFWQNNVCYKGGDLSGCLPTRTGNWSVFHGAKTSFTELAPYRGNVGLWLSYEYSVEATWSVSAGEWWSFFQRSASHRTCFFTCSPWEYDIGVHGWNITDADGDGYHFAYAFRWNCNGAACDSRP